MKFFTPSFLEVRIFEVIDCGTGLVGEPDFLAKSANFFLLAKWENVLESGNVRQVDTCQMEMSYHVEILLKDHSPSAKCRQMHIFEMLHFLNARFRCDPLPKWLEFPRWPNFGIRIFEVACYFK